MIRNSNSGASIIYLSPLIVQTDLTATQFIQCVFAGSVQSLTNQSLSEPTITQNTLRQQTQERPNRSVYDDIYSHGRNLNKLRSSDITWQYMPIERGASKDYPTDLKLIISVFTIFNP
jgi:hypothetical protein